MISIFAALNGSILSGARVPYAAARDGYFFHAIGRVHPQYHTPGVSIIVLNRWACLLVLSGKYDDLFNLVIFASWILYGMTAAAVLGTAQEAARSGPALPDLGLSGGSATIRSWSCNPFIFNGIRAAARVRHRHWTDGSGASLLLSLEERQSVIHSVCNTVLTSRSGTFNRPEYNQKTLNLFLEIQSNWRKIEEYTGVGSAIPLSFDLAGGQGRPGGLL